VKRWTPPTLRIIVLLLLGGALVNVAVAWGCAAYVQRRQTQLAKIDTPWIASTPHDWPVLYSGCVLQESDGAVKFEAWAYEAGNVQFRQQGTLAGYPMKSLIARTNHVHDRSVGWRTVRSSWVDEGISVEGWGAFPSRPLWLAFAMNTLFYMALLWLLFAMPFALRRRRRIRRGLCPKCGYDLRGGRATESATCPECGAAVSLSLGRERAGVRERAH
jgi:hypothetical protein